MTTAKVDPRGLRFAAAITAVVLAAVLVLPSGPREVLLGLQLAVFAPGAFVGLGASPYGWVFRSLVRPRIAPPTELEDSAPPQFAQAVGFGFALIALLGFVLGATWLGYAATTAALIAALLNAAIGFCLGCELYLTTKKIARSIA